MQFYEYYYHRYETFNFRNTELGVDAGTMSLNFRIPRGPFFIFSTSLGGQWNIVRNKHAFTAFQTHCTHNQKRSFFRVHKLCESFSNRFGIDGLNLDFIPISIRGICLAGSCFSYFYRILEQQFHNSSLKIISCNFLPLGYYIVFIEISFFFSQGSYNPWHEASIGIPRDPCI